MRKIQVSFSIEPDILKEIDKLRDKENRSRNYVVNRLLEKAIGKSKVIKRA